MKFEKEMEVWEASEKREIQERLEIHQVVEAAAQIVEHTPEAELSMKVGSTSVKDLLADFGDTIHLGKINGKYVLLLKADSIVFEKGVSPIEFHKPDVLMEIVERISRKSNNILLHIRVSYYRYYSYFRHFCETRICQLLNTFLPLINKYFSPRTSFKKLTHFLWAIIP